MTKERHITTVDPFTSTGVRHATVGKMRLHMRRESDGALLWINGLNMLVLNPVAADLTEIFINGAWELSDRGIPLSKENITPYVIEKMAEIYDVDAKRIENDFNRIYGIYSDIAKGSCPSMDLGLMTKDIKPELWTAPPRMDLALTYKCNNDCLFCYAECGRTTAHRTATRELNTDEWKSVIDKLWQIGVPQLLFSGGEATLRPDLVDLVGYSQEFVTGLVTNGRNLGRLAEQLKSASLDFAQVSIESANPEIHDDMVGAKDAWQETVDGIVKSLEAGLFVTTNTTLTRKNAAGFIDLIRYGKKIGLRSMACNSLIYSGKGIAAAQNDALKIPEIIDILTMATQEAKSLDIELQWYSPTYYLELDPVKMGFGAKSCSAAQFNMTIEPDGRVIPCQSWIHEGCGNILTDEWKSIWENPLCLALRKRNYAQDKECSGCQHLDECGGGCPLEKIVLAKGG